MFTGPFEEEGISQPIGLVDISHDEPENVQKRPFATSLDPFTNEARDDEVRTVSRFVASPLLLSTANWGRPQSNCTNCSRCTGALPTGQVKLTPIVNRPTQGPNAPLAQVERPAQILPPAIQPTMPPPPINTASIFNNAPNVAYHPGPIQPPPIQAPPQIQNVLPPGPPPQFNPVGPNYGQPFGPLPMGPTYSPAPAPPFPVPPFPAPFIPPPMQAGNPFLTARAGPPPPLPPPPPPPPQPLSAVRVGPPNIPPLPISRPPPPVVNPVPKMVPQPPTKIPQVAPPAPKSREEFNLAKELRYMHISSDTEVDSDVTSARATSRHLRDIYADLNELGLEAGAEPFDTTRTFVGRCVQRLKLVHPTEWRLSLRIHSCTNSPLF